MGPTRPSLFNFVYLGHILRQKTTHPRTLATSPAMTTPPLARSLLKKLSSSFIGRSCSSVIDTDILSALQFFFNRSYRSVTDTDLLSALQSELKQEKSSNHFQEHQGGSLGDFVVDWDAPQSQDVVLRRRYGLGEEIAVSALLGPPHHEENDSLPRHALMKVCITKPSLSNVLQFDCGIFGRGASSSVFEILSAYYLRSPDCAGASVYRGPLYSSLDPELQKAFKEYLISRGITVDFTNFLLLHLHKKEQDQYVNWLHKLEAAIVKD